LIIKGIVDEDFLNYKKPTLFIAFPYCDFKCDKENGNQICQNSSLAHAPNKSIEVNELIKRYLANDISKAVLCGGLEPLESFDDVLALLETLRKYSQDDFVIYTGFNKSEIEPQLKLLKQYSNVIIKFGRFIPGHNPHYDPVLGVELASDNQYAEKIS
jgi:organic radical activating enzyme